MGLNPKLAVWNYPTNCRINPNNNMEIDGEYTPNQEDNPLYGSEEGEQIQGDQAPQDGGSTTNSPVQEPTQSGPTDGNTTTTAYGPYEAEDSQGQPQQHGATGPETPGQAPITGNPTQHGTSASPESTHVDYAHLHNGPALGNYTTSPGSSGGELALHEMDVGHFGEYLVDR